MKTRKLSSAIILLIMLFGFNAAMGQQWANNGTHIYNTNSGNVGIGTGTSFTPTSKLHINNGTTLADIMLESAYSGTSNHSVGNLRLKNSTTGDMFNMTLRKNGTVDEMLQSCYDASASLWREFIYYNYGTRKYEMRNGVLDAEFKNSGNIYFNMTGNVGIHTSTPQAALDVYSTVDQFARLGYNSATCNYFFHKENNADGDGQAGIFSSRTSYLWSDGTGYAQNTANSAINGYNNSEDFFAFGTTGFSSNTYAHRSGGVLGAHDAGDYWGALGYFSSSTGSYGGYFTSSVNGGGKGKGSALSAIGIGAWGDLFGADIHGKVYGIYAEGDNYAMFSHGATYKDNLDVHLQANGDGSNTPLYTNVSADVTIMTSGTATLSGGKATINFDKAFADCVSANEPVVVTVTPIGGVNAVSLAEVKSTGFKVVELNNGKSNVTVNYIAIGKRAGYEQPKPAKDVIDPGYVRKVSRGLHNDNDLSTNGEGLYYDNGQLVVGADPNIKHER